MDSVVSSPTEPSPPFLTKAQRLMRRSRPRFSKHQPYSVRVEPFPGGSTAWLWFLTTGCTWDRCTMCNYGHGPRLGVSATVDAVRQGLEALDLSSLRALVVSPSGSMLDPVEVHPEARSRIFDLMCETPVPHLLFESRSELITDEVAGALKETFGTGRLLVHMGLESATPWVRRLCVNKGRGLEDFRRAVQALRRANVGVVANVTLGALFLSPREAVEDAVRSIAWAIEAGADYVVLLPIHVKPHSLLAAAWQEKLYESPSLWALVEVLHRLSDETLSKVTISWYFNYYDEPFVASPTTCPRCRQRVIEGLHHFREQQTRAAVDALRAIDCPCRVAFDRSMHEETDGSIRERVEGGYRALSASLGLPLTDDDRLQIRAALSMGGLA